MKGIEIASNERLKEMDNNMELKKLEFEKGKINIENSNNQRKEEYNLKVKEIENMHDETNKKYDMQKTELLENSKVNVINAQNDG